jgi:hypothetical protein
MFTINDQVTFPDPLTNETVAGTFQEVAGEPLEVPFGSGTRLTDAAWVRRDEDGTTARVAYERIRPA